jgi:hypothetical protein
MVACIAASACGQLRWLLRQLRWLLRQQRFVRACGMVVCGPDGCSGFWTPRRGTRVLVRDALGRYASARLGDPGAVLISTRRVEKACRCSAGGGSTPARQGRSPTARVGVFLACTVPAMGTRVLMSRELYIPRSWLKTSSDAARRAFSPERRS